MTDIRLRDRPLLHGIQLFTRQSQRLAKTCVETALYLDRPQCMSRKQFECFEVGRLSRALTKDLSEIEEVNVILEDEIGEPIHRQSSSVQFAQKRMTLNCLPDSLAATS